MCILLPNKERTPHFGGSQMYTSYITRIISLKFIVNRTRYGCVLKECVILRTIKYTFFWNLVTIPCKCVMVGVGIDISLGLIVVAEYHQR